MGSRITHRWLCNLSEDRHEIKKARGGGVIIYISNGLSFCSYEELNSLQNEKVVRVCYRTFRIYSPPWVVTTLYCRARSQTATEKEIYDMFRAISIASKHQALIMGDFNYPGI